MRAWTVAGEGIAPKERSFRKHVLAVLLLGLFRLDGARETHSAYLLTSLKSRAVIIVAVYLYQEAAPPPHSRGNRSSGESCFALSFRRD